MKKIISLLLLIVFCFSLSGCEYYESTRKVSCTTYANEIFNGAQNHETYNGLRAHASNLRVSYFENLNEDEFASNFNIIINEGHDFIWCLEKGGKNEVVKQAKSYPEVNFGIIDVKLDNVPQNVVTISFREEEGGFLAGYIAAKSSKTGIIGFVGENNNPITKKYACGFIAGANYASKLMGTPVQTEFLNVENEYDKQSAKLAALSLYNDFGCDIIFHALQTGGHGVIEAAGECEKLVIGSGTDQASYDYEHILASIIKNTKFAMSNVMDSYVERELEFGKNYEFGMSDRLISLSKTNILLDKKVNNEAREIRDAIAKGNIKVPSNDEELKNFLEKN